MADSDFPIAASKKVMAASLLLGIAMVGGFTLLFSKWWCVAAILCWAVPVLFQRRVRIGADGMNVRWLGLSRYYPYSDLSSRPTRARTRILIETSKGKALRLFSHLDNLAFEKLVNAYDLAKAAHGHWKTPALQALQRGGRDPQTWLDQLDAMQRGTYRDIAVTREELWTVLENPAAPDTARAGAAKILRARVEDRPRIRVTADQTASPRLRKALRGAAAGRSERKLDKMLARV